MILAGTYSQLDMLCITAIPGFEEQKQVNSHKKMSQHGTRLGLGGVFALRAHCALHCALLLDYVL